MLLYHRCGCDRFDRAGEGLRGVLSHVRFEKSGMSLHAYKRNLGPNTEVFGLCIERWSRCVECS
jgi:hypothetical protein